MIEENRVSASEARITKSTRRSEKLSLDETLPPLIRLKQVPPLNKSLRSIPEKYRLRQILRAKNQLAHHSKEDILQLPAQINLGPIKKRQPKTVECLICQRQVKVNQKIFITQCEHQFQYCEECLDEYTIFRVGQFQEVTCPNPFCDIPIDTNGDFFKGLPAIIQKRYTKIHQFHLTHEDPNSKLCPKEQCEGIIKRDSQTSPFMLCDTCQTKFCSKCLFPEHQGPCDQFQEEFLIKNLDYRKCQCGIIIEKKQGCNHITCICGRDFCYICGEKWTKFHDLPHDQNGNVVVQQMKLDHQSSFLIRMRKKQENIEKNKEEKAQLKRNESDSKDCHEVFLTTLIRIVLFPVKLLLILFLLLALFLFLCFIVSVTFLCCICLVVSSQFLQTYKNIGSLGGGLIDAIKSVWDF